MSESFGWEITDKPCEWCGQFKYTRLHPTLRTRQTRCLNLDCQKGQLPVVSE